MFRYLTYLYFVNQLEIYICYTNIYTKNMFSKKDLHLYLKKSILVCKNVYFQNIKTNII